MDFSRLHMYTPPQCVPENTGYTYALSSSYSSEALDFETEHRLDPVFDSPRMSRRSLRLVTPAFTSGDSPDAERLAGARKSTSVKESVSRTARQRRNVNKSTLSVNHMSRKAASLVANQSSCLQTDMPLRPPVLDASLIREQTKVDHFWGLDDDSDLKGGSKAANQGNGDLGAVADTAVINGYTCSDCSLLSARRDILTTHSATFGPTSRIYSRDRSQKCSASHYVNRISWLARRTSSSFSSFLVQLFHVVLTKLNYASENNRLKSYKSKDCESKSYEDKASSGLTGGTNVKELLREDMHLSTDGKPLCEYLAGFGLCLQQVPGDDCKGEQERLDTHTSRHVQLSRSRRVAGATGHAISSAGRVLVQVLRRAAAGGWLVSSALRAALWLAVAAPGKAASGMFWWLGSGWYQLVTLTSWLNVFLLTRCLRNVCKFLVLFLPLLVLLGAGLSLWGRSSFPSLLPVLNWTSVDQAQRPDSPGSTLPPEASHQHPPPKGNGGTAQHWQRLSGVEQQVMALSGRCQLHDETLKELMLLLQSLQARADQADSDRDAVMSLVHQLVQKQVTNIPDHEFSHHLSIYVPLKADFMTFHQKHEVRISHLEDAIGKLTERSEAIRKELEQNKLGIASRTAEEQQLLSTVRQLELQLEQLRLELASWGHVKASCERVDSIQEQVDAQIQETVRLLFSDTQLGGAPDWLLQKLSERFVSKDDLQALLRDLELQILRNVTQHLSVTQQAPSSEAVVSTVHQAGFRGITEAQARVIVNNALKLYSQDKTGMVDFALESGGGSILSTRCSETYETKTALISLFGIPLWYFSQSPRVVIQPDIYPGNCWAFRGSQGYLVVRLSMTIYPDTFTLEHIPKALSPTGNITSAPKDFAVYGLESEYQEEGLLLGQFSYNQDGESLQMFHTLKPEKAFQIVELRIFSNWGHPEYTCLYRFRVHGEPIK
ncbi:SUN domain-containing protein 1 [Rhynchocyon petersi]